MGRSAAYGSVSEKESAPSPAAIRYPTLGSVMMYLGPAAASPSLPGAASPRPVPASPRPPAPAPRPAGAAPRGSAPWGRGPPCRGPPRTRWPSDPPPPFAARADARPSRIAGRMAHLSNTSTRPSALSMVRREALEEYRCAPARMSVIADSCSNSPGAGQPASVQDNPLVVNDTPSAL